MSGGRFPLRALLQDLREAGAPECATLEIERWLDDPLELPLRGVYAVTRPFSFDREGGVVWLFVDQVEAEEFAREVGGLAEFEPVAESLEDGSLCEAFPEETYAARRAVQVREEEA